MTLYYIVQAAIEVQLDEGDDELLMLRSVFNSAAAKDVGSLFTAKLLASWPR